MTLLVLIIIALLIYLIFIQQDRKSSVLWADKKRRCPNCNNPIEEYFNVCPICKETLKMKCSANQDVYLCINQK